MNSNSAVEFDLMKRIKIQKVRNNLEEATYESIDKAIEYYLRTKAHSYLKSELKHPDSEMLVSVSLSKTRPDSKGRFEGKFNFNIKTGREPVLYHTSTPFDKLEDVISHAFQHLKEKLAGEKKGNHRGDR